MMAHWHFGNPGSYTGRESGDESVLFGIEWNSVEQLAPIGLQGAAVIGNRHAGEPPDQLVGNPGGDLAEEEFVLALAAPAADQVISLLELGDQRRDVSGVVLQIAVERDDDLATGMIEPGHHRRCLSNIAPEMQSMDTWVGCSGPNLAPGIVAAAVVNQYDLEGVRVRLQSLENPVNQGPNVLGLVIKWSYDRQHGVGSLRCSHDGSHSRRSHRKVLADSENSAQSGEVPAIGIPPSMPEDTLLSR
jgi:hypothetical protein